MSSEFQLKLALVREYEQAAKWKRDYEMLTEEFLGFAKELLRYCEENHVELAKDEKLRRLMVRMGTMILTTSDEALQGEKMRRSDEGFTVPQGRPTEPTASPTTPTEAPMPTTPKTKQNQFYEALRKEGTEVGDAIATCDLAAYIMGAISQDDMNPLILKRWKEVGVIDAQGKIVPFKDLNDDKTSLAWLLVALIFKGDIRLIRKEGKLVYQHTPQGKENAERRFNIDPSQEKAKARRQKGG